ncbi:MAG: hypothetical protein M3T49_02965 [Candidatus Eremiobacteraeota bacterium]|nr:hypothetical protein [Candidatus Eremiobacteraeota bacterium]
MKLFTTVDRPSLEKSPCLAESNDFAIYDLGSDTYALVQRHQGVEWQGVTLSGDALFRVSELISAATRRLYKDVASQLSPKHRGVKEKSA